MVSDQQVKRLWRLAGQKLSLEMAAAKAGMDPKTARKYLRDRRLPSEMRQKHTWRTRPDPFADSWEEIRQLLTAEPGLQAKTMFEHLQRRIQAGSVTGKCGHCGAGSGTGERRKDRRGRCSLPKNIGLASCANRTLHTAGNWASRSMAKRFRI